MLCFALLSPTQILLHIDSHDFAGYGSYNITHTPDHNDLHEIELHLQQQDNKQHTVLLQEFEATAISGNDILSSTFYVSGLVTLSAGKLAPLCLTFVGIVLYLFRGIYHETVMALPCNGGTYNILLNCTSKQVASMAAVFAIIAYITTGVVSALEAIAYLHTVVPIDEHFYISKQTATILLLAFFCILTNLGMKESAIFAKCVFGAHVATLSILSFFGVLHMICNPQLLYENWSSSTSSYDNQPSYPYVDVAGEMVPGTIFTALFYGFSSAMLGVSGFETSSQFVEEQAPGVFPKTLKNMWAGVMLFNPLLSLISFSCMPVSEIMNNHDTVLARTAHVVGHWVQKSLHLPDFVSFGPIFSTIVSLDAFVVLAAALLTGYVGINGLIRRMSMDRCLPQFFLWKNPYTGTDSFILVGFFLLCVSQVVVLDSDVEALGGVYCYAFLSVMTIFAFGNILLKYRRPSLPREITVSWTHSVIGLISVIIALLGNILGKPELLTYFFVYFLIVGVLVLAMFQRVVIMRVLFRLLKPKNKKAELESTSSPPGSCDEVIDDSDSMETQNEDAPLVPSTVMHDGIEAQKSIDVMELIPPPPPPQRQNETCLQAVSRVLKSVQDVPFIFFCKHDDLYMLNKAMLYIQKNEQTRKIIIGKCQTCFG